MTTEAHLGSTLSSLLIRSAELDEEQARIKRQLAALSLSPVAITYGSRKPYPAPPGWTHRTLRDKGPTLVEHGFASRTEGKRGRGVFYLMTAEQHRAYEQYRRPAPNAASDLKPSNDVDSWISAGGYRATKRSA